MKFFKSLKKLIHNLTKDEDVIEYEKAMVEFESELIENEEEIAMNVPIENPYVSQVRDWAVNKIELLHEADRHRNAKALLAEFDEWINIPEGTEEIDYLCLEEEGWTDEQELDVREPNT